MIGKSTNKYILNQCYLMDSQQFLHELDSSEEVRSPVLGKRVQASSTCHSDIPKNMRLVKLGRNVVFQGILPGGDLEPVTENHTTSSVSFESMSQLLVLFLTETLANEILNLKRFSYLPETCQILASIFLKESLNYDICEETENGSSQKHLYKLVNRTERRSPQGTKWCLLHRYSFLAECYMYGLRKQLSSREDKMSISARVEMSQDSLVETLYTKLFGAPHSQPSGQDAVSLGDFKRVLTALINEEPLSSEEVLHALTPRLLEKLKQLPVLTLQKYYAFRTRKYLQEMLRDCKSVEDLTNVLVSKRFDSLDLFSGYSF